MCLPSAAQSNIDHVNASNKVGLFFAQKWLQLLKLCIQMEGLPTYYFELVGETKCLLLVFQWTGGQH